MTVQIDSVPMEDTTPLIAVNTLDRVTIDNKSMEDTTPDIQVGDISVAQNTFTTFILIDIER